MTPPPPDVPVTDVDVATYSVPTDVPEGDGTLSWAATPMVLVQVRGGGQRGMGWTYGSPACGTAVTAVLAEAVEGTDAMDVPRTWEAMVRAVRNDTRRGAMGYAVSAVDCALWDLKARLLGVPLFRLLGAARDEAPVYGSGGFTTYTDQQTRRQLEHWAGELGIPRVKIKVGEAWGARTDRDLARVALARQVVGEQVELFVDANGAYGRKQAIRVAAELDRHGVTWLEEPVSGDDVSGLRAVRDAVRPDVAAGEYAADLHEVRRLCGAVDCVQLDATRCGGITEWLRAAAVAEAHGLEVSGHCAPNQHAHPAMATPNLRHLEWFHDHVRIESLLFDGALDARGGALRPDPGAPGTGLTLRRAEAERYRVR